MKEDFVLEVYLWQVLAEALHLWWVKVHLVVVPDVWEVSHHL